jgi:CheY-like chemotaxis protein
MLSLVKYSDMTPKTTLPKSLLLVEDNELLSLSISKQFENLGYVVSCVPDVAHTVSALQAFRFDVVLLDYMLEDGTGLDVLSQVQELGIGDVPPIVMMSGVGNESVVVRAMKLGATDYIVKDNERLFVGHLPIIIQDAWQSVMHTDVEGQSNSARIGTDDGSNHLALMCAWTHRMKYQGQWISFEAYLAKRFGVKVTHGICKEAADNIRSQWKLDDDDIKS